MWMEWPEIIINANTITKKSFVQEQNVCWDWIYHVRTLRFLSDGSYTTVISYAKDPTDKHGGLGWMFKKNAQHGALIVSQAFSNYIVLLEEIKDKARNAEFDNETQKLIEHGIPHISTARQLLWIFAAVFLVVVFIYLFVKS